ncbi:MAG TPA: hypothetical protein VD968_13520 [Pyrinomonadaceae bacterium]|nr:hypothetical protein [Pyrinomonadaceae bacterium]
MSAKLCIRFAAAAALVLASTAFAHRSLASVSPCAAGAAAATRPEARASGPVLRGRGLLKFGGYELNVTFTPGGKLVNFDITAARGR